MTKNREFILGCIIMFGAPIAIAYGLAVALT